ncbi:MAG TPA: DoxX family protein [Burkholderiales bacterium]|nr:DoxX family protein [Burkholderiales bacterium]
MSADAGTPKPILPAFARIYQPLAPCGYAFLRVCTGAILIPHGAQKLFSGGAAALADKTLAAWGLPAPLVWAYGIGVLEFLGGALLVLGLLTRPVALLLAVELLVFIFGVHVDKGWLWNRGGVQYPLFLLGLCLAFLFRGGGHYSLDRVIGKEF